MKLLLKLGTSIALCISAAPVLADDMKKDSMTAKTDTQVQPPIAEKRPHSYTVHGETITDEYHWLRDQGYPKIENKEILAHLDAENAYFEAQMKPQAELVETIFHSVIKF